MNSVLVVELSIGKLGVALSLLLVGAFKMHGIHTT